MIRILLLAIYIVLFIACFAALMDGESIGLGFIGGVALYLAHNTIEKLLNNNK